MQHSAPTYIQLTLLVLLHRILSCMTYNSITSAVKMNGYTFKITQSQREIPIDTTWQDICLISTPVTRALPCCSAINNAADITASTGSACLL